MVAADGTFIEAPSSTKNKTHARDPEMASGKKANTWHFGMKEHIAACSESGYIGCHKRAEIQAIPFKDVSWYIAARPSAWKKELSISENFGGELGQALVECVNVKRQLEHAKASVRCSIEWCFLWLKRIYGYAKVRYRGLAKNHSRALTLFALYNCNRLRKWKATLLITPKLWCALRLECHGALPTLENDICPIFRQISSCFSIIRKNRTTNVHGNFRRFSTPGQKSLV